MTSNNWDTVFEIDLANNRIHKNKKLIGYKGFDNYMYCMGFKYEVGKTYKMPHDQIKLCANGFHFCRYPIDVLYYNNIYAEIEANDIIIESNNKCVTNCITIRKIITMDELLNIMPDHIIRINMSEEWYKNGKLHRDNDLPAVIDGVNKKWYKYGKLHRDNDLPAVIKKLKLI